MEMNESPERKVLKESIADRRGKANKRTRSLVNRGESNAALKGLLDILMEQVKAVEEDIEALYNNWFIGECDDWTVPYIGELTGILGNLERGIRDFREGIAPYKEKKLKKHDD